ncbi:MAG: hypothetical protein J6Z43_06520 [Clostridiales bacterium]|nr:hypothetical protein [Clostridiales bacterium]
MKITTFDPVITTAKPEECVRLFEALGFVTTHTPTARNDGGMRQVFRMKNDNGDHVDIVENKDIQSDEISIRMNVDDFDEAHAILLDNGFTDLEVRQPTSFRAHKGADMVSPSGFKMVLMEHVMIDLENVTGGARTSDKVYTANVYNTKTAAKVGTLHGNTIKEAKEKYNA